MSASLGELELTVPTINSIKEKMSLAFMYSLNSTVNYSFSGETSKDIDALGIDLIIMNKVVGPGRTVSSEANQINVQLKGVSINSSSMISETLTSIKYNLTKKFIPYGTHYLIVVVLPKVEDLKMWCEISPETILLRARAYFIHMEKEHASGFIEIPKENILTIESYKSLFDASKIKNIS